MARRSNDVVQLLLDTMVETVRDYHPDVRPTPNAIADLIQGTAMFPGGTGLWRGRTNFGPMPEWFPEDPVMLVAHNFDSVAAFERSRQRGGEVDSQFWRILAKFLEVARVSPDECFFTNALMGLKPGSALGPMPTVPGYEEQCRAFLLRQIDIVSPRVVIALGNSADAQLKQANSPVRWLRVRHPSAREFVPLATREEKAVRVGEFIRNTLALWSA